MKKFEYKITQFKSYDKKAALKELNKFGKDGWELIQIIQEIKPKVTLFSAIYKREK